MGRTETGTGDTPGKAAFTRTALVLLVVALQYADIVTTNHGLTHTGVWEGNPLVEWCMSALGVFWWVPVKSGFVAYLLLTLPFIRQTWPLAVVAGIFLVLVVNNLAYW